LIPIRIDFVKANNHRKIDVSKEKLEEKQREINADIEDKANGVSEINERIGALLEEAEKAGMAGEVEKSQKIMADVEALKEQKRDAEASYRNSMPSSLLQQQRLRVCEVCSSYLENFEGLHDNVDKRLADHYGGKLHLGFIELRDRLKELSGFCAEHRDEFEKSGALKENQRSRSRSRERSKRSNFQRRSRSRSRERTSRNHHHRSSNNRRSRSRERHHRSSGGGGGSDRRDHRDRRNSRR